MKLNPRQRGMLSAGILAALLLTIALPFLVGADARHLSAYAQGEEDASLFHAALGQEAEAFVATPRALADAPNPQEVLLVVLGVERPYDASEARAIVDFLHAGGRVLLVDETGYGNAIAQAAGFAVASHHVLDTRNHLGDPNLVDASVRVGDQPYRVLFNKPSEIVPLENAKTDAAVVLARTSTPEGEQGSYADYNGDGEITKGEKSGPFNLAVRAPVGEGVLVIVADTGPFMNRHMAIPEFDNPDFAAALVASLVSGENARILIDESRHAPPAALAPWDNALRTMGRTLQGDYGWLFVLLLFTAAGLAWRFTRPTQDWSHHEFDLGHQLEVPPNVRPDASRVQRFAQRRISEKYNIPMEQVQAMTAEQLAAATGDRALAEAAAGTARADPTAFFRTLTPTTEATQ